MVESVGQKQAQYWNAVFGGRHHGGSSIVQYQQIQDDTESLICLYQYLEVPNLVVPVLELPELVLINSSVPGHHQAKPADLVDRNRMGHTRPSSGPPTGLSCRSLLGRRRVGKSFLLSRFARDVGGLYYQATRRTEAEQLATSVAPLANGSRTPHSDKASRCRTGKAC